MKKLFMWLIATLPIMLHSIFQYSLAEKLGTSAKTQIYLGTLAGAYIALFSIALLVLCIIKAVRTKSILAAIFIIPTLLASLVFSWGLYYQINNITALVNYVQQQSETKEQLKQAEQSGATAHITEITTADQFNTLVKESTLPIVLKCSADWCPPCKMMKPIYQVAAISFANKIMFVEVNTDNVPALTEQLNIKGLPTFIGFKDGKEALRIVGAKPKNEFIQELQKLIA